MANILKIFNHFYRIYFCRIFLNYYKKRKGKIIIRRERKRAIISRERKIIY